jgi:exopolysaccharide production protein ExoZ
MSEPIAAASSRPARSRPTIGSLEIGRFVAASVVVIDHLLSDIGRHSAIAGISILGGLAFPGAIAVQFFFVLSGFVMMTAHHADFGRAAALPRFWWRRICRIYPAYWVTLLIPIHYLYAFLTPSYLANLVSLWPVDVVEYNPPAWTLRYEVAFYLVFGLCLLPKVGRPLLALWVAAVCWVWCPPALLSQVGLVPPAALTRFATHAASRFLAPFEFYFFAGLLGGWIVVARPVGRWAAFGALTVGVAALAAMLPATHWGHDFGSPAMAVPGGLSFAAVILGLAVLERHGVLRFGRMAKRLGAMSYPLYILHAPLLLIVTVHTKGRTYGLPTLYVVALLGLVSIYALSAIFAFGIDQPIQRLLRRPSAPTRRRSIVPVIVGDER